MSKNFHFTPLSSPQMILICLCQKPQTIALSAGGPFNNFCSQARTICVGLLAFSLPRETFAYQNMYFILAQETGGGGGDLHSVAAIKVSFSSDNQVCIIKTALTAELIFRLELSSCSNTYTHSFCCE